MRAVASKMGLHGDSLGLRAQAVAILHSSGALLAFERDEGHHQESGQFLILFLTALNGG